MKKQIRKCVAPGWEVYQYMRPDGSPVVVSFDLAQAKILEHPEKQGCGRILLSLLPENQLPNGLPVDGMVVQLEEIERDLIKSLETADIDCLMVGRLSYSGKREMVFQFEPESRFEEVVATWMLDFSEFKVEFLKDEGWKYFEEEVKPTMIEWQQVIDRRMIDKLVKAGTDPTQVHQLEHTVSGAPEQLKEMAEELEAGGFRLLAMESDRMVISRPSYLDLAEISQLTGALFRFAMDMGLQYEGWGARVVS